MFFEQDQPDGGHLRPQSPEDIMPMSDMEEPNPTSPPGPTPEEDLFVDSSGVLHDNRKVMDRDLAPMPEPCAAQSKVSMFSCLFCGRKVC